MRRPVPQFIAAAACLAIVAAWLLFPAGQPKAHAFNLFAKALVEARSATFEMTAKSTGQPEQMAVQCYYFAASGRMRTEMPEIDMVAIMDTKTGKMLMLNAKAKLALVMNVQKAEKDPKKPDMNDIFEQMRDLLAKSQDGQGNEFKPLGEKEIDGHRALGFRHASPTNTTTLWGDPETGLPVLVEVEMRGITNADATMSHFKLNEDLKPELFDMTPPADYTVQTLSFDASKPTEAALIEMLEKSSDLNEGKFLDILDQQGLLALITQMKPPDEIDEKNLLPPKLLDLSIKLARGMQFAWELPESADAHYAGKGVKRGEPDRPIFWYKPEGKDQYRVIFADLSVKEVAKAPEVAGAAALLKPKGGLEWAVPPLKAGDKAKDQDASDPKDEIPTESDASSEPSRATP